ncbi:MAG: chemotaxis protein CheW [Desulfuromonadales bacterium]
MDIAEIRKKAKQQRKPDADDAKAKPQVRESLPASESPSEQPDHPDIRETVADDADQRIVDWQKDDALDQLFAVTEEYALAASAASADILDVHAEARNQTLHQYLAFHLGHEEYALDITEISEIIKVREFTDIPRVPNFILGIISLRGVVVPVFDLRLRLNLGASNILPTSRIVVTQRDDMTVGLLVDRINQVVNLSDEELEPPPGVLSGLDREMIYGIGRCQERMVIVLNLGNILHAEWN